MLLRTECRIHKNWIPGWSRFALLWLAAEIVQGLNLGSIVQAVQRLVVDVRIAALEANLPW